MKSTTRASTDFNEPLEMAVVKKILGVFAKSSKWDGGAFKVRLNELG